SLVHRDREVAVLRSVGVLAPLPMPTIDSLALHAASMEVAAGQEVFHQGDAGDSFYVIKAGEADVVGDGRLVRTLGAGDCFGEVAWTDAVRRGRSSSAIPPKKSPAPRSLTWRSSMLTLADPLSMITNS